jgi:hypothetical protein
MNPFGIHETSPALPFAKTLRVNSFGIHEKAARRVREKKAGASSRTPEKRGDA